MKKTLLYTLFVLLVWMRPLFAAEITVVHAGWLLAVPGEPPASRQSIVIENGRITRVANGFLDPARLGNIDTEIRLIDLSKKFVLPGLFDAHVHLASSPGPGMLTKPVTESEADLALVAAAHARQTLQVGFTTVVDLGAVGIPGHENAIFGVRDAVRKGSLAGPRVLSAGTPISATSQSRAPSFRSDVQQIMDSRAVCNGADDCRRAVRHQAKRGSDIIAFFNTGSLLSANPVDQAMSDEEMRAIVDTAHSLGRKVIADGHHAAGIAAAIRAGADVIDSAHLYDDNTFRLLGDDVFLQSHIYGVVQAVGEDFESLHNGLWGWLPDSILLRFQAIGNRPFAMIEAYRQGVRNLVYASDAGVYPWGENAGDFVEFVERGMSEVDAIRTATVNAARMLGLDQELGSIEPGKIADLIATSASPLDDISELTRVRFVMRDGIVFKTE
jgi:imidazolonepropionase-like amidohydrolase